MGNNPFYSGGSGPPKAGHRNPFDNDNYDGFDQLRQNVLGFFVDQKIGGPQAAKAFQQALAGVPVTADKFLPSVQFSSKSLAGTNLASKLLLTSSDGLTSPGAESGAHALGNSGITLSSHEVMSSGTIPGVSPESLTAKISGVGDISVGGANLGDSLRGLLDLSVNTHPGNPAGAMKAFFELMEKLFTVVEQQMINSMPDADFYAQAIQAADELEKLKLLAS
jgi:hypothetical protein